MKNINGGKFEYNYRTDAPSVEIILNKFVHLRCVSGIETVRDFGIDRLF